MNGSSAPGTAPAGEVVNAPTPRPRRVVRRPQAGPHKSDPRGAASYDRSPASLRVASHLNFVPIGIKVKMATILPLAVPLGKEAPSPECCTGFEIIVCPDVDEDPDLGGMYHDWRMKHALGRPQGAATLKPVAIELGDQQIKGRLWWWLHKGTWVVRYQIFVSHDVEIVAVGPEEHFALPAFRSLLRSLQGKAPVTY